MVGHFLPRTFNRDILRDGDQPCSRHRIRVSYQSSEMICYGKKYRTTQLLESMYVYMQINILMYIYNIYIHERFKAATVLSLSLFVTHCNLPSVLL